MVVQGIKPKDPLKNPVPHDERASGLQEMVNDKEAMKALATMEVNSDLLDENPDEFFKMLQEASGGEIICAPIPTE